MKVILGRNNLGGYRNVNITRTISSEQNYVNKLNAN